MLSEHKCSNSAKVSEISDSQDVVFLSKRAISGLIQSSQYYHLIFRNDLSHIDQIEFVKFDVFIRGHFF